MKKRITFLMAALLLMSGLTWAQQISWTAKDQGYENGQEISAVTFDSNVSGHFYKGTNNNAPKYYTTGTAIRCYGGNYFTISASSGNLTSITMTFSSGESTNAITTDVGTYENGNWTGEAQSVTFTIGGTSGHRRIASFSISYSTSPSAVAMPTFNPASGTEFGDEGLQVSISCETTGTVIYFTLDGSVPDDESNLYNGPITLTETTTIKAIAYDGNDNTSSVATATYTYVDPNVPGTENNPYTVAQARAAIDAGSGTQGVYARGIVSAIPTAYSTQFNNITFNFVDNEGDSDFLQAYRCGGDEAANVAVGDIVLVYGNLTKYNTTYEFGQGCTLVSLTHPTGYVEAPTFTPAGGTYAEAQTVTISCETPNVDIYYTTDGSNPDDESTPYNGAITVSETTTIKAIAYDGNDQNSAIATATYHFCSADDPYTVTEALAFNEYPANGIYVHGIVSTAPTMDPTNNGELTYYISVNGENIDQLEVYKGKGLDQAAFTAQDDIQLGDIVTVYGNVVIYGTNDPIKEFAQGNYLVSFERPIVPIINANDITLAYDANSGEIEYTITNPVTGTALNATTDAEWISNIAVGETSITFNVTENEGNEDRTATVTLTYAGAQNKEVTVTQSHFMVDYATLPFEWDSNEIPTGITNSGVGFYSSSPYLKFDNTGDYILLHFQGTPGTLTFDIKGNSFSGGTFTVQTSEDGENYTDLETYTSLTTTVLSVIFDNLGENVRYIKWIYTEKASGNVALGNIHLYEFGDGPVFEAYDLTIEPFENLEIFTFVDDELTEPLEGAGTIQVTEGVNVMLSVSAETGYVMQSLMVDGVEHVNDITEELTYSFVMPNHNVTVSATAVEDVPPTPFEPATYTLATTIESGKTYIIVGQGDGNYYAMGQQNNNNRAAVEITVEGTTATVSSEEVYEFTISSLAADGFYSIYDARTPGYLYAAASGSNHLKTESELDSDHNGEWEITFDTDNIASIVASQSSNRNVMQYNRNSTLFSCYGSASQHPVYLYVKDETPSTVTQTVSLIAGTNWFSTYVDITLDDLKAALANVLGTSASATIKSMNANIRYSRGKWGATPANFVWDVALMYKIEVSVECEFTLEGTLLNPAEHPITISTGINWIGFPFNHTMSLTDAFDGFAINGDAIKSVESNNRYARNRWSNTGLTTLEPGQGYMYTSEETTDRILTFPTNSSK